MSLSSNRAGFTLIEIMVVMVIIGVIISIATLSLEGLGRDTTVPDERDRLFSLIRLANDQAIIENAEYGLHMSHRAYRFLRYREEGWQPVSGSTFRRREWPEGVIPELRLEDSSVELEAYDEDESMPQILLTATGQSTPFTLTLRAQGAIDGFVLQGRADGAMRRWNEENGPPAEAENEGWMR